MTKLFSFVMLWVSLALFEIGYVRAESTEWPVIREESGSISFDKPSEADFVKDVRSLDGRPLYELRCRSGDLDDVGDFNYSGLLQCRLSEINAPRETPRSLLFEDREATSDWDGRGRFMLNDVIGTCGRYPDFGDTRIYRVRGMQLTLRIEDVRLRKSQNGEVSPTSFVFSYAVKSDRQAVGALTERPVTKEPTWFSGEKCLDDAKATLTGK
ncbi:hypothetical protein FHW69_000004 [Luteibacter sp. Sphag1AF]|uniref:hypothetical protein n=1 Tax=Luteibacter sp. Sphag1AF TaxID=2587031 RepID=UPI0016122DB0|nr:hypothetical protein [Luteibacter sp. Sphag1AF]MBB3225414.1 hypothetical protein [Luteibacter sp. Sphag1AF]